MSSKKTTPAKPAAKKLDLGKLLPALILLLGLIIMTVCFVTVNGKLSSANEKIVALNAQVESETALRQQLETECASLNEQLTVASGDLATANERLTTCEDALNTALTAIQTIRTQLAGETEEAPAEDAAEDAADEAPAEDAAAPADEATMTDLPAEDAAEDAADEAAEEASAEAPAAE